MQTTTSRRDFLKQSMYLGVASASALPLSEVFAAGLVKPGSKMKFIQQEDLFSKLNVAKVRQQAILDDEVERLGFATEFLEEILFSS